jgi:hypothetical protein
MKEYESGDKIGVLMEYAISQCHQKGAPMLATPLYIEGGPNLVVMG